MSEAGPVLLVDDDEAYRAILRHCLEQLGCEVLEAADGAKAYKILSKTSVRLVVLDIVMPNTEGLETISRLRHEGFRTKILAVSGATKACEYLRVAALLGADANMEKIRPVSELVTLILALLGDAPATDRACLEACGCAL